MMVDTDYHRRGLGTSLLRHVEDMLFEMYEHLMLESFNDNVIANAEKASRRFVEAGLKQPPTSPFRDTVNGWRLVLQRPDN